MTESLTAPGAWVLQANCASVDPELFYPDKGGSPARAKKVCRACPVKVECLAFALDNGERFGVWGATTEDDRRALRGRRPRSPLARHGTLAGESNHRKRGETPCRSCQDAANEYRRQRRATRRGRAS